MGAKEKTWNELLKINLQKTLDISFILWLYDREKFLKTIGVRK